MRLEQERRRELCLVEARIEQAAVEESRRMDKLLGYGEDDLVRWKRSIEPHHFNTVRSRRRLGRTSIPGEIGAWRTDSRIWLSILVTGDWW